jgi:3'-phosphoadenosine 5'-phosphosulfate sulfotransferase (PAPS reductase)/FAD synthetase
MNIVNFSGGKDSTAMLLMMLEKGIAVDRIICADTTKEFPQMYEHIKKVQEIISPIEIEMVKIDFDYWFGEHVMTKGKHKGRRGYGWPGFRSRWCTALKREAIRKARGTIPGDHIQFHGIAFDEKERSFKNAGENIQYPLIDWHITEKQALRYCYSRGLDWGGLYKKLSRVSCWCCPLSRISELRVLYNDFPNLWQELVMMDEKSFWGFRNDYSIEKLNRMFANENLYRIF